MGCQSLMHWAARPAVAVMVMLSAVSRGVAADAAAPAADAQALREKMAALDREIETVGKEADAAQLALMRAQKKSADLAASRQGVPDEAASIARRIGELTGELQKLKKDYEKALAKNPEVQAAREATDASAKRMRDLRLKRNNLRAEREAVEKQLKAVEGGAAPN